MDYKKLLDKIKMLPSPALSGSGSMGIISGSASRTTPVFKK